MSEPTTIDNLAAAEWFLRNLAAHTESDDLRGQAEAHAEDLRTAQSEVARLREMCIPLADLVQELNLARQNLHHARAMSDAHFTRVEAAQAEVRDLRAKMAAVEALADRLAAALAIALHDAHPVYGNTTGWRGGIGGASITSGCSMIDPPPGMDWLDLSLGMLTDPLRSYLRAREAGGSPLDLDAAKKALEVDLRAALIGEVASVGRTEPETPAPFTRYSGTAGSKVDAALGGDE